ncbi:cell division protein DivIB [Bacillus cereus]|jgi:cell division protein FtsQ|uniref:cell division protein DivIB n=1 Tax=Bacillus cereus TaxID=1396 RepID=UPI00187AB588|nr:cell division protein DivIB [Bacillus cereus]MBE7101780.1 cell division protein DivIB [Bacillus cereus]MBE7119247.1 cell division protein DivIB [Bacillus cereus]
MKNSKVIKLQDRVPKLKNQKKKNTKPVNHRLILYISILFLLVLFLIYFRSPLSNIKKISVFGNHYMTDEQVMKESGVTYDTSYFRVTAHKAEENLTKRKEIKEVNVKKRFPNKIDVHIEEYLTIGYINKDGKLQPLLENGKTLDVLPNGKLPVAAPIFEPFKEEKMKELIAELEKLTPTILRSISEIRYTPTNANEDHLTLYMNEGYEVSTTIQNFAKRMEAYPLILKTIEPGKKVLIDLEVGAYTKELGAEEKKE